MSEQRLADSRRSRPADSLAFLTSQGHFTCQNPPAPACQRPPGCVNRCNPASCILSCILCPGSCNVILYPVWELLDTGLGPPNHLIIFHCTCAVDPPPPHSQTTRITFHYPCAVDHSQVAQRSPRRSQDPQKTLKMACRSSPRTFYGLEIQPLN